MSPIIWRPHNYYTTPAFPTTKPCAFLLLIFQCTHPYYTKDLLPPTIRNIPSITLHTSTLHPVRTHQNSHHSSDKHILDAPCIRGANLKSLPSQGGINLKNPWLHGFTAYWQNVLSYQDVLLSSKDITCPTLNLPLTLLKNPFIKNLHTVQYPSIGPASYYWQVAFRSLTPWQLQTSLDVTHTTQSTFLCFHVL